MFPKHVKSVAIMFYSVCAVLLSTGANAQLFQDSGLDSLIEVSSLSYHIDDDGTGNFEEIKTTAFTDSTHVAYAALMKLNPRRKVWLSFEIKATGTLPEALGLTTSIFSRTTVYSIHENSVDTARIGFSDIGNLYIYDKNPEVAHLPLSKGDKVRVLIAFTNYHRFTWVSSIRVHLWPVSDFEEYYTATRPGRRAEAYFYIFFCGLLIFQTVYILLQWYLVRRTEYAYYVLYTTAVFFYFYGRLSVYYAESPAVALIDAELLHRINDVMLILPSFFYFRFARYFSQLTRFDPLLNKQFKVAEWLLAIGIVAIIVTQAIPNDLDKQLPIYILLSIQFLFSIHAMIRIARQQRTVAWFLVAGSACAMLAHFLAVTSPLLFSSLSVPAPVTITLVGIFLELVIFNTGLLFKAKEAEADKVKAQKAHIRELKTVQKLREDNLRVRDEISSDLHDDIGSTLSSIGIYNYAARQKLEAGEKEKTQELLINIENSTDDAMNSMSDLVWATNPANDSTERLVERIREFAFEVLRACGCRFSTDVDPAFLDMELDHVQRKNILLIMKEAVNNTAKYAGATKARLEIKSDGDGKFVFTFVDDGVGFGSDKKDGNGMRTMRARAAELSDIFNAASQKGSTTIQFGLKVDPQI